MKNKPKYIILTSIASCLGLLFATGSLHAQSTLLEDSFDSVTVSPYSSNQTATTNATTYHAISTNGIFTDSTDSALNVNGSWTNGYVQFSPVTLAKAGDYITLSFTVQYPTAPTSNSGGLRFGLFDSGVGTEKLFPYNETSNATGGTAAGYFAIVNTGGTNNTSMYRNAGTYTGGSVMNTGISENRLVGFTGAAFGTTAQTIVFTITRADEGKLTVTGSIAGTAFNINATQVGTPVCYTFNTFVFGSGNLETGYKIDDLTIKTNVPIPETSNMALLIGGAATGTVFLMRRKR